VKFNWLDIVDSSYLTLTCEEIQNTVNNRLSESEIIRNEFSDQNFLIVYFVNAKRILTFFSRKKSSLRTGTGTFQKNASFPLQQAF